MTARDASGLLAVTGTVVGAENVVRTLSVVAPSNALERLRTAVHGLGFMLEASVKNTKLSGQVLGRVTGRLVRSINTRFSDTATSSTATVGTNVSYGRIWELTGSRGFEIVPANKSALFWKGALHPVKRVFHPAQSPRPFLRPALQEMRPVIRDTIEAAMTRVGSGG